MFALVDCNNFFVSCERIFSPALKNKPVVVLSNNDGCIIARSQEAKLLGIPMGAPLHEYKSLLKHHNVALFSANFGLYSDISQRVMQTLASCVDDLEIYSIDEAFLDLSDHAQLLELAQEIRKRVLQWVGVPVSIGIAPTKTLAKLANSIAKKESSGIYIIDDLVSFQQTIMPTLKVGDIWGVGYRSVNMLRGYGIWTIADFIRADDRWLRKKMTIRGLQTAWELRGISCLKLEDMEESESSQKSIICSRSFGHRITSLEHMKQAVAEYTLRAAERLRTKKLAVTTVMVYITTSKFAQDRYSQSTTFTLPVATDYTPLLISQTIKAVEKIYVQGYEYKKAGVVFMNLSAKSEKQHDLFYQPVIEDERGNSLMQALDTINARWGRSTIHFAATGLEKSWLAKSHKKSPAYTTCWQELLTVKI